MSGYEMLGDMIGGGLEARKENAFQDGRFRAAQTENALTNARVNQAKAIEAEKQNAARADYAAMLAAGGIDYTNPSNDMLTNALLGGLDLRPVGEFRLKAQEFGNRDTLGNPEASALDRSRASDAVQGKFEGDLTAVGSHGYYDRTDEDPTLSEMAGLGNSIGVSSPIQNYNFRAGLGTPQEQQLFDQMVRSDKVFGAGGVPYAVPGVNPTATPPRQLVTPQETAGNVAALQHGRTTATTQAKLAIALPGVVEGLDKFEQDIDAFLAQPGFDMVYGKSGAAARMSPTPLLLPEDYRNAAAMAETLGGEAFQNSIQKMRGLGALSNAEGEKVQVALTAALNRDQDEAAAARHWAVLKTRLARLRQIAEVEAGLKQVPGINVGAGAAPAELPPVNAQGWQLMIDAAGNKAYVGPNNEIEEVQ